MASVAVGDVVECEKFPDAWCACCPRSCARAITHQSGVYTGVDGTHHTHDGRRMYTLGCVGVPMGVSLARLSCLHARAYTRLD